MEYIRREDGSCLVITRSHFALYRNALPNVDDFEVSGTRG